MDEITAHRRARQVRNDLRAAKERGPVRLRSTSRGDLVAAYDRDTHQYVVAVEDTGEVILLGTPRVVIPVLAQLYTEQSVYERIK